MDTLNRSLVRAQGVDAQFLPNPALLDLPEKVLQFGTGAFLRGFADYFIDRANRQGLFGGRIVAVGSTGSGRTHSLNTQGGLYTVVVQGMEGGNVVDTAQVVSAISRAFSAADQWADVLACAANPDLVAIVSNTTEVGITLDDDDQPDSMPPRSFPGKLTAFLHARAQAFGYAQEHALVVLPCELLTNNGDRLREIVETLAQRWYGDDDFMAWLGACRFCNTLVDRIVPGTPDEVKQTALFERLGYRDDLLITAEPYRLWAIEGDEALLDRLPFLRADDGIIVTDDITPYRELKVRILNGTHTSMVPVALQYGLETVREAVIDPVMGQFIRRVMLDEIVPSLDVDRTRADAFAHAVLDRFANPFIVHLLRNIMLQATMKTQVRVVPSIQHYYDKEAAMPETLALGFAFFLLLRRDDDPAAYPPDDRANRIREAWHALPSENPEAVGMMVHALLANEDLWHTDLTALPGFEAAVRDTLLAALRDGVRPVLDAFVDAHG